MKRAPRSRQRHDLYAKYHDQDSEISDLLGECGFFAVVRRMVSEGGGIAVVDALNGMQELADGVVSRPFQPTIHHRLAMITNSISDLSQPAQQFAALLSAEIERVCEI